MNKALFTRIEKVHLKKKNSVKDQCIGSNLNQHTWVHDFHARILTNRLNKHSQDKTKHNEQRLEHKIITSS